MSPAEEERKSSLWLAVSSGQRRYDDTRSTTTGVGARLSLRIACEQLRAWVSKRYLSHESFAETTHSSASTLVQGGGPSKVCFRSCQVKHTRTG